MKTETQVATGRKQIHLTRRSPNYWRVTIDHPPLNVFGPETIPQLNEVITALETDEDVKVVVFDSAVEGFFLTHYDFLARIEDTTSLPPGPTGLQPLPDMVVRLSRAPVVSIASIRGRATGVGSELALALRHALREPRKSGFIAMRSWRRHRDRRWSNGAITASDGARTCTRSASRRGRHSG